MDRPADIVEVLRLLAAGDVDAARRVAARIAYATRDSPLAHALNVYLSADSSGHLYDQPAGFAAFIRGGGNVALYRAVSAALAGIYDAELPRRIADIGCGDGLALVPALTASRHPPGEVDVVEPSAPLLQAAVQRFNQAGLPVDLRSWLGTAGEFLDGLPPRRSFGVAQSTFALHAVPHEQRSSVLSRLRPHVRTLAIVEFDVPSMPPASAEHLRFLAETYERGLSEYDADRDLVAQGFLMPVLVGQLAPDAVRATWEQPASAWQRQVEQAGYTDVSLRPVHDYWSSPAFLLRATGSYGTAGVD